MLELKLPDLPYHPTSMEPYVSAETFSYHYNKHHNNYVTNGNKLIKAAGGLKAETVEEAVRITYLDQNKRPIFNNVAQHWNHVHFWNWMKPGGGGEPEGDIGRRLQDSFGSYDAFRSQFINKGFLRFGSGWVWLVKASATSDTLAVVSTPNGENPLSLNQWPILGCDVWEHSYYIDYRNDRLRYLETFLDKMVNWDYVQRMLSRDKVSF